MRAIIFFLTFSIFVGFVIWRSDKVITADKMSAYQSDVLGQIIGISKALSSEVNSLQNIIQLSYSDIDRNKSDFSLGRPYSQFQMLGQALPPPTGRKGWQIIGQYYLEKSEVRSWAGSYISLALESVQAAEIPPNQSYFVGLLDPQRKPYLLMVYNFSGNWYLGLLGEEIFQATLDKLKNQKSSYFVVNSKGQALAHATREYIGSLLTEDPIVSELQKGIVDTGNGEYSNLKGEKVQGFYQKIEGSNAYSVTTTPTKFITGSKDALRVEIFFLGAGILLIGLAIFFLTDREPAAPKVSPQLPPMPPQNASFTSQQVSTGAEKMKAYTQVASALSHELKPAVTSILGYSQLAMNGASDSSRPHLEKIIEEAREAREVLQKLLSFAGEDKLTIQLTSLETILQKALKNCESKISSKGIKLLKNFQSFEPQNWPFDLLVNSLEAILMNAIESMDRAPKKELQVQLEKTSEGFVIRITDTGEGISAQNISRVFDPFFTTRSQAQHVGLGLSTALGIAKELKGEIRLNSELGKGTTVILTLPLEGIDAATAEEVAKTPARAAASVSKDSSIVQLEPETAPSLLPPPAISVEEFKLQKAEVRPMDPLIVDTTIERLIEGDLPDMPPPPGRNFEEEFKIQMKNEKLKAPSAPATMNLAPEMEEIPEGLIALDVNIKEEKKATQHFSAKIEKPKINLKKKSDFVDNELPLSVRKPGENR